jgi:hypothetical protein
VEKSHPNHEALTELRKLISQLGGSPLPDPSGWDFCDDCNGVGPVYELGRVKVCARDWVRRDRCRLLAIKPD